MKKFLLFVAVAFMINGCATISEEQRFQQRFDNFYNLLNEEEQALFAENDLIALGASLDIRENADEELSAGLESVKIYEAIMTYENEEAAVFYRDYILRELNRKQFYKFMEYFDSAEQLSFVAKEAAFYETVSAKEESDRSFNNFMENMKSNYRLYHFTSEQVVDFFREVSFPEVSRKQVFYLFELLDEQDLFQSFVFGNISVVSEELESVFSDYTGYTARNDYNDIKDLSGLNNTDTETFLKAYLNYILVEMDQEVLEKTIQKF